MAMVKLILAMHLEQQPQSDQALGSMVEPSVLNVAIQQKCCNNSKTIAPQVKVIRLNIEDSTRVGQFNWRMAQY